MAEPGNILNSYMSLCAAYSALLYELFFFNDISKKNSFNSGEKTTLTCPSCSCDLWSPWVPPASRLWRAGPPQGRPSWSGFLNYKTKLIKFQVSELFRNDVITTISNISSPALNPPIALILNSLMTDPASLIEARTSHWLLPGQIVSVPTLSGCHQGICLVP